MAPARALRDVLDRLAATPSAAESERLLLEAFDAHASPELLPALRSVAAVCTTPPRKAAAVGHTLVRRLACDRASQALLLAVYQANAAVLGGVLSALESDDAKLPLARALLSAALLESSGRHVHKLAVVHTLVRTAWSTPAPSAARAAAAAVLVRAAVRTPLAATADADAWAVYPAVAAAAADLVVADHVVADVARLAAALLRRVSHGLTCQLPVVALLQTLLELARAFPAALGASRVLVALAGLLLHAEAARREQSLVLATLAALLPALDETETPRRVLVEALVVPLVHVLPTLGADAAPLLQRVLDVVAATRFAGDSESKDMADGADDAHAASFLALAGSTPACEAWLQKLFQDKDPEIQNATETLLIQLGASLVDRRGRIRLLALDALDRQVQRRRAHKPYDWPPSSVKLLVSTLVVLTSHRPQEPLPGDPEWLSRAFQVLASLAATTTETMKIVLRLIKRMASGETPGLRSQALHLAMLAWKQDSRVYQQLETLLQSTDVDGDDELVRMATILAVCEKDPETGVEWISDVQRYLEADSVSVVAMAVRAVARLSAADCLDYETATKSFLVMLKKDKISCPDEPLFQQELCRFYAVGGAIGFTETSPKYGARVVAELWEYAEAGDAGVRKEAYAALNGYSLEALGLEFVGADADEEDEDEESLTEQDVEENVDRVWMCLRTERDSSVRAEVEKIVARVLESESKKLAPGGASRTGTGIASAAAFASLDNRVSAAATKELKKHIPTRQQVLERIDANRDWRAKLLAFEPDNVVESTAAPKRKDKRLRLVMSHVDEMKAVLDSALEASTASYVEEAKSSTREQFLYILQSVEAWNSFARKYFGRLDELALLRTPMDAPEGHTAGLLSTLLDEQVSELVETKTQHVQRWLAIGALVLHADLAPVSVALTKVIAKTRAALRSQVQQSIEELRVFKDANHSRELQLLLLGTALAHPRCTDDSLDALTQRVAPLCDSSNSDLLNGAAVLFMSHASSLPIEGEDRAARRSRLARGAQLVLSTFLRATFGDSAATATTNLFADSSSSSAIDAVVAAASTAKNIGDGIQSWAAGIGLGQLAGCFASVHRLAWLDRVRLVLEHVWKQHDSLDSAVALGPVLLESVKYNRVASSQVEEFVSGLQKRAESSITGDVSAGTTVLPFMIQRLAAIGCIPTTSTVDAFVGLVELKVKESASSELGVAVSNFVHGSTGVSLAEWTFTADREIAWEPSVVQRVLASLSTLHDHPQLAASTSAASARAAIADRSDSFFVVQKNKTFDAQISKLPATSLVFKTLEFLRVGGPADDVPAVLEETQSAVKCVAHAARSFPLPLDFSSLILRVASRYAAADRVIAASLELAASHASGVSLLLSDMISPDRLLNYSPELVEAAVDALVTTRSRLMDEQLTLLLVRVFDALVECWDRDSAPAPTVRGFEKWISFTGTLVEVPKPKDGAPPQEENHLAVSVTSLVLDQFLVKLPFTPTSDASKSLLRQFARDVLSKIPQRDAVANAVTITTSINSAWSWWRTGVLLSELLRLSVITSSSVVLRWLLQFDFARIEDASVLDAFVADVANSVCGASGKRTPLEVNEAWLLELLDGIAQTTGTSESLVLKRRVFFDVAESIITWTQLRGHESLILAGDAAGLPRAAIRGSLPALAAQALLRHHHERSGASQALTQRFWTMQTHAAEAEKSVVTVLTELHVIATAVPLRLLNVDTERELLKQLSDE